MHTDTHTATCMLETLPLLKCFEALKLGTIDISVSVRTNCSFSIGIYWSWKCWKNSFFQREKEINLKSTLDKVAPHPINFPDMRNYSTLFAFSTQFNSNVVEEMGDLVPTELW